MTDLITLTPRTCSFDSCWCNRRVVIPSCEREWKTWEISSSPCGSSNNEWHTCHDWRAWAWRGWKGKSWFPQTLQKHKEIWNMHPLELQFGTIGNCDLNKTQTDLSLGFACPLTEVWNLSEAAFQTQNSTTIQPIWSNQFWFCFGTLFVQTAAALNQNTMLANFLTNLFAHFVLSQSQCSLNQQQCLRFERFFKATQCWFFTQSPHCKESKLTNLECSAKEHFPFSDLLGQGGIVCMIDECWNIAENVNVMSLGWNCGWKCSVSAELAETVTKSNSKSWHQNCICCSMLCAQAKTSPKTETVAKSVQFLPFWPKLWSKVFEPKLWLIDFSNVPGPRPIPCVLTSPIVSERHSGFTRKHTGMGRRAVE